jgi:uncharacterized membrane protein (DUF2068 family)
MTTPELQPQPVASRPLGVVLVTIYTAIGGIFSIIVALPMMAGSSLSQWFPLLGALLLVDGVLDLAACYGLWTLSSWGHTLAQILYLIYIPLSLLLMAAQSPGAGEVIAQLVGIGICVAVLVWLSKPTTKRLYQKP